jgi:hypothetical protein
MLLLSLLLNLNCEFGFAKATHNGAVGPLDKSLNKQRKKFKFRCSSFKFADQGNLDATW